MKLGNWTDDPCYYVTCRDAGRTGYLLGPYQTPEDALADVVKAKYHAEKADPWAAFYSFGTAKVASGRRAGVLNAVAAGTNPALDSGRSLTMRERGYDPDQYVSIGA